MALQKNRYWRTPDGLSLDGGPLVRRARICRSHRGDRFSIADVPALLRGSAVGTTM